PALIFQACSLSLIHGRNAKDSEGQAALDGEPVVSQQRSLMYSYCRASHPEKQTRGSSPGVLMHCTTAHCNSYQGPLQKAKGEWECIRADNSSRLAAEWLIWGYLYNLKAQL
ncbi:hypothetical protein ABG768_007482, partial [Culter alburnus]